MKTRNFGDKIFMTIGILIIWPALFNTPEAKEYGFLKAIFKTLKTIWRNKSL